MDKKELQEKIEKLEMLQKASGNITNHVHEEIAILQSQLESEKPELRHGDVIGWIDGDIKDLRVILNTNQYYPETLDQYNLSGLRTGTTPSFPSCKFIKHFNIFTDFAAMSEPLEEFEMAKGQCADAFKVYLQTEDCLVIKGSDKESVYVSPECIHDFILNLRRMEATSKKEQAEK